MSHSPLYPFSLFARTPSHLLFSCSLIFFLHCPLPSHCSIAMSIHMFSQMVTRMNPSPILTSSHLNCIACAVPILIFKPPVQAVGDLSPNIKLDHTLVPFYISFNSVLLATWCTSSLRAKLSRVSPLSSRPNATSTRLGNSGRVLGRGPSSDILESFALKLLVHQETKNRESNEM